MLRIPRMACVLLLMAALGDASAEPKGAAPLRAGAAKVDITPPASALNPGDAIRDPLYARAIVISNGLSCAVLVGVDQANISTSVVDEATQRASKSVGCPADSFIISATHTHSGNTAGVAATGSPTALHVGDAIVKAAEMAHAKLKPARIGYGTTQVYLNVNRGVLGLYGRSDQ